MAITPVTPAAAVSSSTILMTFVALVFGLSGTYALRVYMQPAPEPPPAAPPAPKKPALVTVPMASRDIPAGAEITMDDVALYKMTPAEMKKKVPGGAFMASASQIIGKVARNPIARGKTFDTGDFYAAGTRPGVVRRIEPGLRAITLVIDSTDALLGLAAPGQHVDVLFHYGAGAPGDKTKQNSGDTGRGFYPQHHDFNPPRRRDYRGNTIGDFNGVGGAANFDDGTLQHATTTLVQDVEVLALGKQSMPTDSALTLPDAEPVEVTLAVSPQQAELLRVATGHGKLSLTMRNTQDSNQVALVDPVTLEQIIDLESSSHKMEIYRGSQLTHMDFRGGKVLRKRTFATEEQNVAQSPTQPPTAGPTPPTTVPVYIPYWLEPPAEGRGATSPTQRPPVSQPAVTMPTDLQLPADLQVPEDQL